jgi:hypothetical protein
MLLKIKMNFILQVKLQQQHHKKYLWRNQYHMEQVGTIKPFNLIKLSKTFLKVNYTHNFNFIYYREGWRVKEILVKRAGSMEVSITNKSRYKNVKTVTIEIRSAIDKHNWSWEWWEESRNKIGSSLISE